MKREHQRQSEGAVTVAGPRRPGRCEEWRPSIVLSFVVFVAGFVVNFGTVQLMRVAELDQYATPTGIALGCVALVIAHSAGARWAGRNRSSN